MRFTGAYVGLQGGDEGKDCHEKTFAGRDDGKDYPVKTSVRRDDGMD